MDALNSNMDTLNANMGTLNINMNVLKFNMDALCLNAIDTEDAQTKKESFVSSHLTEDSLYTIPSADRFLSYDYSF